MISSLLLIAKITIINIRRIVKGIDRPRIRPRLTPDVVVVAVLNPTTFMLTESGAKPSLFSLLEKEVWSELRAVVGSGNDPAATLNAVTKDPRPMLLAFKFCPHN